MDTKTAELVAAIKKHAQANYERGGWDYVVECYSDQDIADGIAGATTVKEAVTRLGKLLGIMAEIRADHEAEAAAGS